MEYNAQGHVTYRQLPTYGKGTLQAYTERYTYDTLGRELKVEAIHPSLPVQVVSTSSYDGFVADPQ